MGDTKMMKATAIFCRNKSKIIRGGAFIMWAEKIKFSHVAVLIEDHLGRKTVFESVWPKSRKMDLAEWEKHYECVESYSFPIVDIGQLHTMNFYLKRKLNKWYSILQLVWIGIGLFIKPLAKLVSSNRVNGSKHLICTELAGDFFKRFYGAKWLESTDTISLTEARDEIKKVWGPYANISNS